MEASPGSEGPQTLAEGVGILSCPPPSAPRFRPCRQGRQGEGRGYFFTAVANYEIYQAILSSTSNYLFTFFFFFLNLSKYSCLFVISDLEAFL